MASQSRRPNPSVAQLLFEEAYRFDFFQAVRLLERRYPQRQPLGRNASPSHEAVRFGSHLSLDFPPSAIHELTPADDGQEPARMTVAFMGLTGPLGVLPRHYTELLLERARRKDHTLRDFLDLLNHRFISLFYRAWEKYRFPIAYERTAATRQGYDPFSLRLFDLIGMGTQGLRERLDAVEDETLLFYTGLLGQRPHSASALAGLLQDYFEVPVEVIQFQGQWLPLAEDYRSRLGPEMANNTLGVNAVIGDHAWDQQATFRLRVGPLTYTQFCQFLPTGRAFRSLLQLTRFFAGQEYDFDVQLVLKAAEVPWCCPQKPDEQAPRLGWSAWLKTREFPCDAEDAVFTYNLPQSGF